jgi:hypothetical protein
VDQNFSLDDPDSFGDLFLAAMEGFLVKPRLVRIHLSLQVSYIIHSQVLRYLLFVQGYSSTELRDYLFDLAKLKS